MKNGKTEKLKSWTLISAALGLVLLAAAAGCIKITVKVAQTTETGSGATSGALPHPSLSGGNFVPVQAPVPGGSTGQTTPFCGKTVTTNKVLFQFAVDGQNVPSQTPPAGTKGFWGQIVDLNNVDANGHPIPIPNANYVLQLYAGPLKRGCCTNVLSPPGPANTVGTSVSWAGSATAFTACFFPSLEPPAGHQLQLRPPPGNPPPPDAWTY